MGLRIQVTPGAYLAAAAGLLLLPARWWMGALLAAAVHELAHLLMIWLSGGQITFFQIGIFGAKMEAVPMGQGREVLASLAGPLGSLLFAGLTARFYPEAALCAFGQGIFNLLPVCPLDGWHVLFSLVSNAVCRAVEVFTLIILFGMGIWFSIGYDLGGLPLLPACFAALQRIPGKIPCKETKVAVQ